MREPEKSTISFHVIVPYRLTAARLHERNRFARGAKTFALLITRPVSNIMGEKWGYQKE
jgi:hypothetical protein